MLLPNKRCGVGNNPAHPFWWQFWQWKHCYLRNMHRCVKAFYLGTKINAFMAINILRENLKKSWSKLVNWCQNNRGWYVCLLTVTAWLQPSEFLSISFPPLYLKVSLFLNSRYCLLTSFGRPACWMTFLCQSDMKGKSMSFHYKF